MYPHSIRLRGPWECRRPGENPRRITVPCLLSDWDLADADVLLTRKFGYPGRIDAQERVWLTFAHMEGQAAITLNGALLGEARDGPFASDVTALLGPHNQLEMQVRGVRIGDVAMEIRALAFLEDVRASRADGKLRVEGRVVGTCAGPLELYILVDGRHALYRTIEAGQAFLAELEEPGQSVRVELVHVSTVWYAVELVSS
jgi:hypothetical protein